MIDDDLLTRLGDLGDHLDNGRRHHPRRADFALVRTDTGPQQRSRPRDGRSRRVPAAAAVVVLVGALAIGLVAIRHRDSAPTDQVPSTSTPTSEPIATYRGSDLDTSLPLVGRAWYDNMEFSLDRRTNARIYDVWQTSIANCMHQQGLDYQPARYSENTGYEDQVNPLDRAYAAVMGYHPLPHDPINPNTLTDETVTAAGECSNAFEASPSGQLGNYFSDVDQLRSGIDQAVTDFESTDTGIAVTAAWADCMTKAGYDYASPADPTRVYEDAATISAMEIATRIADLDCDAAVGYTQARHDWEAARIAAWRAGAHDAIQAAIADRTDLEQRLAQQEISVFGAARG